MESRRPMNEDQLDEIAQSLAHRGMAQDAPEKDRLRGFVFSPSPWKKL